MKRGITRRWLINGFGVIAILLIVLEVVFAMLMRTYYYESAESVLSDRAQTSRNYFLQYTSDVDFDFEATARDFAETFTETDAFELQLVNRDGQILMSSTGFTPTMSEAEEFSSAVADEEEHTAMWNGLSEQGENLMSVTAVICDDNGNVYGAVRYVTSLTLVDRQMMTWVGVMVIGGVVLVIFVMLSSSYFVSSIVRPLKEIGETAKTIAMGDYEARIEKKYDDEIGDLADTINFMAGEIARGEKMKNEFISTVSHELRTPLTAITGWSETMGQTSDPEIIQKGMQVISHEARRLSGIVEELLDFSRLQSGQFELKTVQMDLLAELEETVLLFRERASREDVTVDYIECIHLPPIIGDPDRLKQVFINVMDNAIKYSNPGSVIHVEARLIGSIIKIIISDNGIGISSDALPHVKERFFRANPTKPGSGIGLALADEIVRRHGGTLDIRSEEGVGTTVTIRLPVPRSAGVDPTIL